MDDLIIRQAAIDALRAMQTYKLFAGDDQLLIDQAGAQTELMMLPPAQPEQRWIPFSEWLPESGRYLVSCPLSVFPTVVLNYTDDDGEWFYDGCKSMDMEIPTINALMPLPEPYKGDES